MIKLKTYYKQNCHGGVLEETDIKYTVTHVEQMLELQSSELRSKNMTAENLEIAANMFIYLLTCPFYNIDNYMMKSGSNPGTCFTKTCLIRRHHQI